MVGGRAQRAIVWYPALVAYGLAHPQQHFTVAPTTSPYADWHLAFAFGANGGPLQKRVDAALARMSADDELRGTAARPWTLRDEAAASPGCRTSAARYVYLDGSVRTSRLPGTVERAAMNDVLQGRFIKVAADTSTDAPSFDRLQADHGKTLYASSCAKCHGGALQGVTAPALRGPAFAPAQNAHLTIGGIFGYMATNMPADLQQAAAGLCRHHGVPAVFERLPAGFRKADRRQRPDIGDQTQCRARALNSPRYLASAKRSRQPDARLRRPDQSYEYNSQNIDRQDHWAVRGAGHFPCAGRNAVTTGGTRPGSARARL